MNAVPDYLQYASPFGWAIIVALLVLAFVRPKMSMGPAVLAAATAAILTKTIVLEML